MSHDFPEPHIARRRECPPTQEQVAAWLRVIDDESNHPVLVHRRHGVIRTGIMVAIYEMEHLGLTNANALDRLPSFGHDLGDPSREPIREFIRRYEPRAVAARTSKLDM